MAAFLWPIRNEAGAGSWASPVQNQSLNTYCAAKFTRVFFLSPGVTVHHSPLCSCFLDQTEENPISCSFQVLVCCSELTDEQAFMLATYPNNFHGSVLLGKGKCSDLCSLVVPLPWKSPCLHLLRRLTVYIIWGCHLSQTWCYKPCCSEMWRWV